MSDPNHDHYLAILADVADNHDPNSPKPEWAQGFASRLARDGVPPTYRAVTNHLAKLRAENPDAMGFAIPPKAAEEATQEAAQASKEQGARYLTLAEMTPEQKLEYHYTKKRPLRSVQPPEHLKNATPQRKLEYANELAMAKILKDRDKK